MYAFCIFDQKKIKFLVEIKLEKNLCTIILIKIILYGLLN